MSESFDPGSHASFTHSAWRELALSLAGAVLLLGGSDMSPWAVFVADAFDGADRSPAAMCAMWSSIGICRWHAESTLATTHAPARIRGEIMKHSECKT